MDKETLTKIEQLVNENQNIFLMTSENADEETILATIAFQKALEQKGKKVSIYSNSPNLQKVNSWERVDHIKSQVAPQNLIISLNCGKDEIEKISYDAKDDQFNLVITPKNSKIDTSKIAFATTEIDTDLIIVIGASNPDSLGHSYKQHIEEFGERIIINIDNKGGNELFGTLNAVDYDKATICEIVTDILIEMRTDFITTNIGNNLLMGLYLATNSFKDFSKIKTHTFAYATKLLEKGAHLQTVTTTLYNGDIKNKEEKVKILEEINSDNKDSEFSESDNNPTPFVKGQENQIEIEEPKIFNPQNTF